MRARGVTRTIETVGHGVFTLLRLILTVETESWAQRAIVIDGIESVPVKARIALSSSDTTLAVRHVAVSTDEVFECRVVHKVLVFSALIEADSIVGGILASQRMGLRADFSAESEKAELEHLELGVHGKRKLEQRR